MEPVPLGQLMEELLEQLEAPQPRDHPMTRPDPTNHQAADQAAFLLKGHLMNRTEERDAEVDRLNTTLRHVRNFAELLIGDGDQDDPNYRDAGREAAGRQLLVIVNKNSGGRE